VSVAVVSVYHGNAEKEEQNVVSMLFIRWVSTIPVEARVSM